MKSAQRTLRDQLCALADAEDVTGLESLIADNEDEICSGFEMLWDAGWSLVRAGDANAGLEYLSRALEIRPDSPHTHWALGMAYRDAGMEDESERSFLRAIAMKDSLHPRDELALLYVMQGRKREAEAVLREGVRLRPGDEDRREILAEFLEGQGRSVGPSRHGR